jgi:uncharacterized membrane protein
MQDRLNKMVEEYRQNIVANLDQEYFLRTKFGNRLSDKIAAFGGSWGFIFTLSSFLLIWLLWNFLPGLKHFDPAPFILLNLILSFLAGFQAPFIMMAQNRHAARDKTEADIDFAINYRSEIEVEEIKKRLEQLDDRLKIMQQGLGEIKMFISSNTSDQNQLRET